MIYQLVNETKDVLEEIFTHDPTHARSYIGNEIGGVVVVDVIESETYVRRQRRKEEFAKTIDTLNPAWYDGLSDDQKQRIQAYRKAWLDYPATGVVAETVTLNQGEPNETVVSTDISDIFKF